LTNNGEGFTQNEFECPLVEEGKKKGEWAINSSIGESMETLVVEKTEVRKCNRRKIKEGGENGVEPVSPRQDGQQLRGSRL